LNKKGLVTKIFVTFGIKVFEKALAKVLSKNDNKKMPALEFDSVKKFCSAK